MKKNNLLKTELVLHQKVDNKKITFDFKYFHGVLKCGNGFMVCSTIPWEQSSVVVCDPLADILSQVIACLSNSGRLEKVGMV